MWIMGVDKNENTYRLIEIMKVNVFHKCVYKQI